MLKTLVDVAQSQISVMAGLDVVKIKKLYDGKAANMQLKLVNGEIIGADNTILNGTCIEEKASVVHAQVRNPSIEGKIELV